MNTKELMVLGIVAPDAAISLPYSVDFTAIGEGNTAPRLYGPKWSVVSGKYVLRATLSAEQVVNPGFETGSPPSNWTGLADGVISSVTDTRTGGSGAKALKVSKSNSTSYPTAYQALSNIHAGDMIVFGGWHKSIDVQYCGINMALTVANSAYDTLTTWSYHETLTFAKSDGPQIRPYVIAPGANGSSANFDDFSVKYYNKADVYAMLPTTGMTDVLVRVEATFSGSVNAGHVCVVARADSQTNPQNYVMATYNRNTGYLRVDKIIANVWTEVLIWSSAGFKDDCHLELRASGTTFQVWINGVQVGGNLTITAPTLDANTIHGFTFVGGSNTGVDAFFCSPLSLRSIGYMGTSIMANGASAPNGFTYLLDNWIKSQPPYYGYGSNNAGVGGSTSWYALASELATITPGNPDVVVIDEVVNETYNDFYWRCEEALIRRVRTVLPNARIVFIGFTRVANIAVDNATNVDDNKSQIWKTLCARYGITFVDFAQAVIDKVASGTHLNTLLVDTVHLAVGGDALAASILEPVMMGLLSGGSMPALPSRLYDCTDLENAPTVRNGIDNNGQTGTWTTSGNSRLTSVANSTITWTGTFSSFGISKTGTGTISWQVDGGSWTQMNLSSYGAGIELKRDAVLPRASHTVVIRLDSGSIQIDKFISI